MAPLRRGSSQSDRRPETSRVLLTSADTGYDDARTIWNRMIVRHPALIVRCAGVDDVVVALRFAREHDLLTSVKGGGHNVTGYAVCADSLMLDLSAMRGARVPEHRGHVFAGDLVQHPQRSDRTLQLPEVIESSFDSTSCRACGRNRKVWNAS